jgi:hypothetical protein
VFVARLYRVRPTAIGEREHTDIDPGVARVTEKAINGAIRDLAFIGGAKGANDLERFCNEFHFVIAETGAQAAANLSAGFMLVKMRRPLPSAERVSGLAMSCSRVANRKITLRG